MQKLLPVFLSALLSMAVAAVAGETYLSLRYTGGTQYVMLPEYESPFVYRVKPNTTARFWNRPVAANNLSMRRREDTSVAPGPGHRILSYGDSIGLGIGVEDHETYPHQLEEVLNRDGGERWEVLNTMRGYSPSTYALHIRRDVPELEPDMVLVEIELLNDVADEATVRYRGVGPDGLPTSIDRHRYFLTWDGDLAVGLPWNGSLPFRTRLGNFLTRKTEALLSAVQDNPLFGEDSNRYYYNLGFDAFFLTSARLDRAFDRMFETLSGIEAWSRSHSARFLLIILPARYAFSPNRYQDHALELYARAVEAARRHGLPHAAPLEALRQRGGDALFVDFCHPTPEGYGVIAEEVAKAIRASR